MYFSTTTCIRPGIHKIELILIDTELKRRSIICLMIGPVTRVGLNSREEKYPNGTLAPGAPETWDLWSKPDSPPVSLLLTMTGWGTDVPELYPLHSPHTSIW